MTTKQTVSFVFLGIALIFGANAMDPDRGGKKESTVAPDRNPAAEESTVKWRKKELPGGYGPGADASKARNAMALANKEFVQRGFLHPGKPPNGTASRQLFSSAPDTPKPSVPMTLPIPGAVRKVTGTAMPLPSGMTVPEAHTGAGAGSAAAPSPPAAVVPAGSMVNTTGLTPSSVAQLGGDSAMAGVPPEVRAFCSIWNDESGMADRQYVLLVEGDSWELKVNVKGNLRWLGYAVLLDSRGTKTHTLLSDSHIITKATEPSGPFSGDKTDIWVEGDFLYEANTFAGHLQATRIFTREGRK